MTRGFFEFLKQYSVIGLAIGVILGGKINELVKAVVDQLIMPFVGILVPGGDWRALAFEIGGAKFGIGIVLGSLLDFIIVAMVVYVIAKKIVRQDTLLEKK